MAAKDGKAADDGLDKYRKEYNKMLLLKGVVADIVLEIVTFPHGLCHVKRKCCFLACTVEVMENTQLIIGIQFRTLRAKTVEMPDKVSTHTGEIIPEVENRLLGVETNITNWQRKQNQNNNFSAVIPYDLEQQRKESKEFLDDLTTRDPF